MLQQESIIGSWLQLFILAYTVALLTKGPATSAVEQTLVFY